MSAACLSAVLYTAATVSLASTSSRATPAALSRSAAIRMDVSARRQGNAASASSLQAAAASAGEQTRDSDPDEDVSILCHAADTVGPAHERSGLRSAVQTMDQLHATRSAAEQRGAYEESTRDGEEDAANAPWLNTQNRGVPLPAQPPWQAQGAAPSSAPAAAYAAPPAAAWRGAAAGQQRRSAPDILLGGLGNLGRAPLGWCFGPPSALYSNAVSAPGDTREIQVSAAAAGLAPPTAGGGASQADEWRAYAAAAAAYEAAAAGGADAADARRAFEGAPRESLAQPRAEGGQPRTRAAAKAKALLRRVKGAGIAGVISFGLVQVAFWGASLPVCLLAYGLVSGHWPDLSDQEDVAQFGAEAFAYVNLARLAAPLRVGTALSLVPWVQANIVDRFSRRGN